MTPGGCVCYMFFPLQQYYCDNETRYRKFQPLSESGHPRPPVHIDAVVMLMNSSALLVETFLQSKDWEGKGKPKMKQTGIDLSRW